MVIHTWGFQTEILLRFLRLQALHQLMFTNETSCEVTRLTES